MKDGAKWGLFGHGDEADAHEAELVVALFPEGEEFKVAHSTLLGGFHLILGAVKVAELLLLARD